MSLTDTDRLTKSAKPGEIGKIGLCPFSQLPDFTEILAEFVLRVLVSRENR